MANGLFAVYRNNAVGSNDFTNVQPDADTLRVGFVDYADDTPNLATDQDIADVAAAGRVPGTFTSWPALGTKTVGTVGTGVFDAADALFSGLTGDPVEAILVAKDTGVEGTSILLALWDTGVTGLPFTPSGGDVTIAWAAGGLWNF